MRWGFVFALGVVVSVGACAGSSVPASAVGTNGNPARASASSAASAAASTGLGPSASASSANQDSDAGASNAFDSAPFLEDLNALVAAMSSHYANLDYAVHVRKMDLARLKRRTETRIRDAKSEDEARRAFRSFLTAFGDAHVDIDWTPRTSAAPGSNTTAGPLCGRLGYETHDPGGVDFSLVGGYRPMDDGDSEDFPGGIFTLPKGGNLGVVRIGLFMETAHPQLCESARQALGLANDAVCDEDCDERMELEVANRLTAALERRLASLRKAGANVVAVDITGNGGGTNWIQAAVRVVTKRPIRTTTTLGVVRHEHWKKQLTNGLLELQTDLAANGDLPHDEIGTAITRLHGVIAEVSTPCDQSALWQDGKPKPTCNALIHVSPVLTYAKPGELAARKSASALFGPSRYTYHEGANTLPLVVLVDPRTASAAEDFVEELEDNHAAIVIGTQTLGAGCGFTNGGIPTILPRSHASVHLPDCARIRADGSNAVAGVTPDILLPLLDRDSPYQRAVKVASGLASAWLRLIAH